MLSRSHGPARRQKLRAVRRTIRTLLSPEQVNLALMRESARVDRNSGADLSFVLFKLVNPRRRKHVLSTVRLVNTILQRIRVTDDLGWFDDQHLGLLLPETTAQGAWALAQDVCETIAARGGARPHCIMYTYPMAENESAPVIRSDELVVPTSAAAPAMPIPVRVAS